MKLQPGMRLRGATDTTEVVVVRPSDGDVDLRCGGHPMILLGVEPPRGLTTDPGHRAGTVVGKRYAHEPSGLELLCTKAGDGGLTVGVHALEVQAAKALPSSD